MTALNKNHLVGVVGAGSMGAGIAQVAASAGHPVRLFDQQDGAAESATLRIKTGLQRLVERGKKNQDDVDDLLERIQIVDTLDAMAEAMLVVEAIVENLDIKRAVFRELEQRVAATVILATNTSSISITAIAAGLEHPGRVAGLHFFNPAPVMKLVEVIAGLATDPATLTTLTDTATQWGKLPVRAKSTPGFIVNRIARPYYAEALALVEQQIADPATIDALLTGGGGFRMGPFALIDLIGNDVNAMVTQSTFDTTFGDPRYRPSHLQRELVAAGWFGRKSGRGFFDYSDNAPAQEPAVSTLTGDAKPIEELTFGAGSCGCSFSIDGTQIMPSDGRSAEHCARDQRQPTLVFDLIGDPQLASRLAFAASSATPPALIERFIASANGAGLSATQLPDGPGLPVIRTVAMIANEAFDAVFLGVANETDIDTAMRFGVNYPKGPIAWANEIGLPRILSVLDNLYAAYHDPKYRASYGLRRAAGLG